MAWKRWVASNKRHEGDDMDPITPVAFDIAAAAGQPPGVAGTAATGTPTVFDLAHFQAQYANATPSSNPVAQTVKASASEDDGFRSVMVMLQGLNGQAASIGASAALQNKAQQGQMTPGDMLAMTTKAYEFLFHCELTSNVANRTSEGVQQLFQQQS
jgi:hypothetical protein